MTNEGFRVTTLSIQNDVGCRFVILSGTKDLFQGEGKILRCAQNDSGEGIRMTKKGIGIICGWFVILNEVKDLSNGI